MATWNDHTSELRLTRAASCLLALYLAETEDGVSWSTSLSVLLASMSAAPPMDSDYASAWLLRGAAPAARSFFRGVSIITAGEQVTISGGRVVTRTIFDFPLHHPHRYRRLDDAADAVRTVLRAAVRDREGPASSAVLASGGLDSSAIWAESTDAVGTHWLHPALSGMALETNAATEVAASLGRPLRLDERVYDAASFERSLIGSAELAVPMVFPFLQDWIDLAAWSTENGHFPIFSGHLADHVFSGHPLDIYRPALPSALAMTWTGTRPSALIKAYGPLLRSSRGGGLRHLIRGQWVPDNRVVRSVAGTYDEWLSAEAIDQAHALETDALWEIRRHYSAWPGASGDFSQFSQFAQIFRAGRSAQESSVLSEVLLPRRSLLSYPFIDTRVTGLALTLRPEFKTRTAFGASFEKVVLRAAYEAALPRSVIRRPARSQIPYDGLLIRSIANSTLVTSALSDSPIVADLGLVEGTQLRRVVTDTAALREQAVWIARVLALELWLRAHFDRGRLPTEDV